MTYNVFSGTLNPTQSILGGIRTWVFSHCTYACYHQTTRVCRSLSVAVDSVWWAAVFAPGPCHHSCPNRGRIARHIHRQSTRCMLSEHKADVWHLNCCRNTQLFPRHGYCLLVCEGRSDWFSLLFHSDKIATCSVKCSHWYLCSRSLCDILSVLYGLEPSIRCIYCAVLWRLYKILVIVLLKLEKMALADNLFSCLLYLKVLGA